jgi:ankyrin repeat protein
MNKFLKNIFLISAAYNGHIKMFRFLVKSKADLKATDEFGNTALSEGKPILK